MIDLMKMTVTVHEKLWDSFTAELGRLPIKRNHFLSNVIRMETPRLAEAMTDRTLSRRANRQVFRQLHQLGVKRVSIDVEHNVARELDLVVKQSHMVRDAFINRMIAFLRSSDSLLKYFDLPKYENREVLRSYANIDKPVSPLSTLSDTFDDPLWYLHEAIREIHDTNLYLLEFPSPKMDGFACWMDDANVKGTRANKRQSTEIAEIMAGFELGVFGTAQPE